MRTVLKIYREFRILTTIVFKNKQTTSRVISEPITEVKIYKCYSFFYFISALLKDKQHVPNSAYLQQTLCRRTLRLRVAINKPLLVVLVRQGSIELFVFIYTFALQETVTKNGHVKIALIVSIYLVIEMKSDL